MHRLELSDSASPELRRGLQEFYDRHKKSTKPAKRLAMIGGLIFCLCGVALLLVLFTATNSPAAIPLCVAGMVVGAGLAAGGGVWITLINDDNIRLWNDWVLHAEPIKSKPPAALQAFADAVAGAIDDRARRIQTELERQEELEKLGHDLKTAQLKRQIQEQGPEQKPEEPRQPSLQEQIDEQQAHIYQLEKDRDQELAGILKARKFEELPSQEQDRYMEADNSWESKVEAEREKFRALKQRRRLVK